MIFRKFLDLYRERQARKLREEIEAQTSSAGAALARRRVAKQKAKQDEMTERLRMGIRAGHVAYLRERSHG